MFFTSWRYSSPWFGAVAGYYIALSSIRFVLLRSVRKAGAQDNQNMRYHNELKTYRVCGYLMIVLISVTSGMIIQMIWQNKGYEYSGLTIFVSAIYSFLLYGYVYYQYGFVSQDGKPFAICCKDDKLRRCTHVNVYTPDRNDNAVCGGRRIVQADYECHNRR